MLAVLLVQSPAVVWEKERVVVQNGQVRLSIDRKTGSYDLRWGDSATVAACQGEVRLSDGRQLKTSQYRDHDVRVATVKDALGRGLRIVVGHRVPGLPELRHVFWVYADRPEALVRLEGSGIATNYIAPVVAERTAGPKTQCLYVPYDNDSYGRYRSDGWGTVSHEVGAAYDDASRNGIVVGSIDHDQWKTGVRFDRDTGLTAFGGAADKETRDTQPHGTVSGREVRSPRMVLGYYKDWRAGLERYGDLNALVKPALPWSGGVPFGWNSWAGHKSKLNAVAAQAATDFIANELPSFRNDGTAYVNLDSFWDNLSREQLRTFVHRAHAAGLKAGIYWTPFVAWGGLDAKVGDGKYVYRDLALKDAKGEPLPKLDGGWPLDPTHPGTLARIDRQLREFVERGFDYVKLDFMSHGALEGRHFDSKATGTQAYARGMQRIVDNLSPKRIGRPFFISLSIAPLFPHGYAHSRRISCDVFADIGASEYLLNSANYGWWTGGRTYRFNDPDHTVVYQPMDSGVATEAETRTRFTASLVAGGMLLNGDDLTKPESRARVGELFRNEKLLALARRAPNFRPVDGATGDRAGNVFAWRDGDAIYVACFNFGKSDFKNIEVPFTRLEIEGHWRVEDLWTGESSFASDSLCITLPPTGCAIFRLTK